MIFERLWPLLAIPGEFDAMDETDQGRWRGVIRQAFEAGQAERDALKAALVQIAAYAEGPVVNSGFDEPCAAQTARNALDAAKGE